MPFAYNNNFIISDLFKLLKVKLLIIKSINNLLL